MSGFIVDLANPAALDHDRFGPKAANQALLGQAGLPTPGGFCLGADAYRRQLEEAGLTGFARKIVDLDPAAARNLVSDIRIALFDGDIVPDVRKPLLDAWWAMTERTGALTAVRSSALMEDTHGSNFAGQFESFLGLDSERDFVTAVKACWAALWSPRVLRYMTGHGLHPADTAMAVLVQPLIAAHASGGGISRTPQGGMTVTATLGLGSAIAQGEVVPDRYDLDRAGRLVETAAGRKTHSVHCHVRGAEPTTGAVTRDRAHEPCLDAAAVGELGRMMMRAEELIGGPVEIEWAMDGTGINGGIKLVQARPLTVAPAVEPDEIWRRKPGLRGHGSGIGWAAGRACVINCECELSRVAPGDVLVTRVAGPALSQILPRVAGVVAELGGSTSHLASLARERGIPMVLGLLDATKKIPDGAQVGVDGVAGIVRWMN